MHQTQADPPAPALTGGRVARYDSHCNLPKPQITALETLDSVQNECLVPRVSRSDRVDSHRVGDWMLPDSRDILLDSSTNSVLTGRPVLLLVDNLSKLALGCFEHDADCRSVCSVVFHNRSIIAQIGWIDKNFFTLQKGLLDKETSEKVHRKPSE